MHTKAVLTSDERHIIIVGGGTALGILRRNGEDNTIETSDYDTKGYTTIYLDSIFVLEISDDDEFILKKSLISLLEKERGHVAITGGYKDELLINGYIKLLFKGSDFEGTSLPPQDIIQMIERHYNNPETLHWMYHKDDSNKHFGIYIKDILGNLKKN